jgi:carbamoyl-phosphate synthase large subunit
MASDYTGILVTGVGSTTGISVVKSLRIQKDIKFKIIGADINLENTIAGSSFCDKFYTVPRASNEEEYVNAILNICKVENVKVIFPIIDIEIEVLTKHIKVFNQLALKIWASDYETVCICNSKYKTFKVFEQNQLPFARTFYFSDFDKFMFPLIIKPDNGLSSTGVHKLETMEELLFYVKRVDNPILQDYVEGREFTIDIVCNDRSELLACVPRERLEVKSGIASKSITVFNPDMISLAHRIAKTFSFRGHINLQCRLNGDGKVIFFEINPRFSASFPLTLESGVNSPLILAKIALGIPLDKDYYNFKENLYMSRYWEEVFYQH